MPGRALQPVVVLATAPAVASRHRGRDQRAAACPARPGGARRHHRRLRRRAPWPPRRDRRTCRRRPTRGARIAVVTFDRHPAAVVRPDSAPQAADHARPEARAARRRRRRHRLRRALRRAAGPASRPRTSSSEVLVDCLRLRCVVVGADFHFGQRPRRQRRPVGPARGRARLRRRSASTCCPGGEGADAGRSRPPPSGRRGRRRRRGRRPHARAARTSCGAPSSTVTSGVATSASPPPTWPCPSWHPAPPTASTPAGTLRPDGTRHAAAINVGRRPTFYEDGERLVEAFLLDFSGDLYGERAAVQLRGPPAGRAEVRLGRGARGPDGPRRGRGPRRARPGPHSRSSGGGAALLLRDHGLGQEHHWPCRSTTT